MLANIANKTPQAGSLASDVHKPATFLNELLSFLQSELPVWRDREGRKAETSEAVLTSQLCAHLNSAARHAEGWDVLQFRVEETDEAARGRKIDLVAAPCDAAIWVEGRRHVDFDTLLPIECKRLPTPKGTDRDEREYVFSKTSTTGGLQRFKSGHHGASHKLGAMIGYIQEETSAFWSTRIAGWIDGLVTAGQLGWSIGDQLKLEADDTLLKVATLRSSHPRANGLPDIAIRHLWIGM